MTDSRQAPAAGLEPPLPGLHADAWRVAELARVLARRTLLRAGIVRQAPAAGDALPATPPAEPLPVLTGLALSGGGIRSATVSLGMLQALARRGALPQIDYLSTVSGGGYAGSFAASLYLPPDVRGCMPGAPSEDALRAAARRAVETLSAVEQRAAGPGQVAVSQPIQWLRDSGRYLAPNGGGDVLFAFSLWLRNLIAVHYVLGTTLVGLLVLAQLVGHGLAGPLWGALASHAPPHLLETTWLRAGAVYAVLAAVVVALAVLPVGVAYWFTEPPRRPTVLAGLTTPTALLGFALGPALALVWAVRRSMAAQPDWADALVASVVLGLLLASGWYIAAWLRTCALNRHNAAGTWAQLTRTRLTRWLSWAIGKAALLLAVAAVLMASRWVADRLLGNTLWPGWGGAGALAAGLSAWKWLSGRGAASADTTRKLAVQWLPLAAALVLGALQVLLWGTVAALLTGHGLDQVQWFALGALLVLALVTGRSFQFLNLSTIQTLYTARIVRAYLGASNGARAGDARWRSVTEPHPFDDISLDHAHGPPLQPPECLRLHSLAPLHLINVTINETVAARGTALALVQQDRKGRPLAVTPDGYLVDGVFHPRPAAGATNGPYFEPLSVGRWVGISGAAFAPGLGRNTRPELALLTVLANVRLGYWWAVRRVGQRMWRRAWDAAFSTQIHLLKELRGRFIGTANSHWYLSDGGHFDNTGVYELLRRRVDFILALDNGADADYRFGDVANLMRLASVDLGARFEPLAPAELQSCLEPRHGSSGGRLAALFGNPGGFARDLREGRHFLLGYRVTLPPLNGDGAGHTAVLVFVKPRLTQQASLDLLQYQAVHPAFPQEPTADQFFDDEQWESYRKLGTSLGESLLGQGLDFSELVLALLDAARPPPPEATAKKRPPT